MKTKKIGILGAGQLGLYTAIALKKRTDNFTIFYQSDDEPGKTFFPDHAIKLKTDFNQRKRQLEICDCIILENEFFTFEELNQINTNFIPDISSYQHFYGKVNQRLFFESINIPGPKFKIIYDISDIDKVNFYPVMAKKNRMSYDGLGNFICNNQFELHDFILKSSLPVLVEELVSIKYEFSLGLVKFNQHTLEFPLSLNMQKDNICHYVLSPFQLDKNLEDQFLSIVEKIKKSQIKGLFAFEFFVTNDNQILINEGAARPHNSLHLTQDLCNIGQFDLLAEIALNNGDNNFFNDKISIVAESGAMINLLGKIKSSPPELILSHTPKDLDFKIYLYGKKEGRVGRKLGHINIINHHESINEFKQEVDKVYKGYRI